jgi:predicted AAA+ superfamily ATPase
MEKMLDLLSQTNYWEKDPGYELGLIRNTYLSAIINSLGNRLIKVLAGQRRTGKSYLVRQLIDYLIRELHIEGKNIFYLNKELYEFESIKTEQDLFQLIKAYRARYSPKGKVFYFIDEVQDLQNWEKPVVSISQDPSQNAEIFITAQIHPCSPGSWPQNWPAGMFLSRFFHLPGRSSWNITVKQTRGRTLLII